MFLKESTENRFLRNLAHPLTSSLVLEWVCAVPRD